MITKKEAIKSIEELYPELDKCVTDIVKARLDRNSEAEEKALFRMEGLIVACQQELSFLHEFLTIE